jgi:hypothetical protein
MIRRRPSGADLIEIARKLTREEAEWRVRLGVPRGFEIPPKPMPAT